MGVRERLCSSNVCISPVLGRIDVSLYAGLCSFTLSWTHSAELNLCFPWATLK